MTTCSIFIIIVRFYIEITLASNVMFPPRVKENDSKNKPLLFSTLNGVGSFAGWYHWTSLLWRQFWLVLHQATDVCPEECKGGGQNSLTSVTVAGLGYRLKALWPPETQWVLAAQGRWITSLWKVHFARAWQLCKWYWILCPEVYLLANINKIQKGKNKNTSLVSGSVLESLHENNSVKTQPHKGL